MGAINSITTILNMRAPGMTLMTLQVPFLELPHLGEPDIFPDAFPGAWPACRAGTPTTPRSVRTSMPDTTVGAFMFGLTQAYLLLFVVIATIKGGEKAEARPWDGADGLEWTVPSPAPLHTFEEPPVIQ